VTRGDSFPQVAGVEHRFLDAGGLRMHLAEAGEGRPIVMLHGWPQHWYLWRRVIPLLAARARVLCPDLRGFGWTDAPGRGYDRDTMAGDVLALLDELGLDRVDLVGHDWGGWIGFLLSLRRPDRIGRFVALSIAPPWPSGDRRGLLEAWRIAYQIPLALPQLGRRAVEHGLARLALRTGSDAFSEGEIEAAILTDKSSALEERRGVRRSAWRGSPRGSLSFWSRCAVDPTTPATQRCNARPAPSRGPPPPQQTDASRGGSQHGIPVACKAWLTLRRGAILPKVREPRLFGQRTSPRRVPGPWHRGFMSTNRGTRGVHDLQRFFWVVAPVTAIREVI